MRRVFLAVLVWLAVGLPGAPVIGAQARDPQMTGLPEITPQELEHQNRHHVRLRRVGLNRVGLERVNEVRRRRGMGKLRTKAARFGKDVGGELGTETTVVEEGTSASSPGVMMPGYVDNSQLKYFPPIRSQGSLPSCAYFSGTYYAMTYMWTMANDLDAKSGDAFRLSPKWTYNFSNGGQAVGGWYYHAYDIGKKHGSATWSEFPYDSNYRAWPMNASVWRNALERRFETSGYVANTHTDTGIEQVKQLLLNGYILNIPTYIGSWQHKTISNDPAITEDDAFVGKTICYWVNGTSGYHGMTVVGYNDHIWVDINGNGKVDSGEKGAFRIANSWGTGWGEGGYRWMAYDALRSPSAVAGGPSSGRVYGWYPSRAHWVTAKTGYRPKVVAQFTVNHLKRDQLRMTLGLSDVGKTAPSSSWMPYRVLYFAGGAYAFNGSTTAVDGTFYLDFTDLTPSVGSAKRWFVGLYDKTQGDSAAIKSFKLFQVTDQGDVLVGQAQNVPQTADAEQKYAWLDWTYSETAPAPPEAVAKASPTSGMEPLGVSFDGAASTASGEIASYQWNFGDGTTGSGVRPEKTYWKAGSYTAKLTITDSRGATAEDAVAITVSEDPNNVIFVKKIEMAIAASGTQQEARATVTVVQKDGTACAGATVTGTWTGPSSSTVSGTTGPDGTALLKSPPASGTFTYTFTVTNVSASGLKYDPSQNVQTSASITSTQTNKPPVAVASAEPTSGYGPLTVSLCGSESYDPDGTIEAFAWVFGDGGTSSEMSPSHIYAKPGTYTAKLTVTDDKGATAQDTVTITVSENPSSVIFVKKIEMSLAESGTQLEANAKVTIAKKDGTVCAGATVSGTWSGPSTSTVSGTTRTDGSVLLTSPPASGTFTYTFTVTNVSATGLRYDAASNVQTSSSISGTTPNLPPVAVASATPTSGTAPLTVKFSGAQSSDPDGTIVKYAWAFGDGGTGSVVSPERTYASPGTYTAKLTVTDDKGATAQDTVTITVSEDPSSVIFVKKIEMSTAPSGNQLVANAKVTIAKKDGTVCAGATVSGTWTGPSTSTVSGTTGTDGSVLFTSPPAGGTFTYTFTVTNVSATGLRYDAASNVQTSASISGTTPNRPPVAKASAKPTSGTAPLTVDLSGAESSDPDGTIVKYAWDFGDGGASSEASPQRIYTSPGTYTAKLTVTDNEGVTAQDSVVITVTESTSTEIFVKAIKMALVPSGDQLVATAKVTIVRKDGTPFAGASVAGIWRGVRMSMTGGTTGADGTVLLSSQPASGTFTYTFDVSYVSAVGMTYDATLNTVTSASISNSADPIDPPVAVASAEPASGPAPLIVKFSGDLSEAPQGQLVKYLWDFGDGATSTEVSPQRTFNTPGTYTAKLTVTDDKGATGKDTVKITVAENPSSVIFVKKIEMSTAPSGNQLVANAKVTIARKDGTLCAGATVSGTWTGPSTSKVSGITGSDGSVLLTSPPAGGTFTYTFTVTNVSATGLRYDAASNVQTSASVSGTVPNQPPVAVASATPTSGTAPLTVKFSGAQSSDPDGSIVKYAWAFGDGGTSSVVSPQHIYTTPGTYTAKLTVTDDKGATAQDTVTITVSENPSSVIFVKKIEMSTAPSGNQLVANAKVTIAKKDGTVCAGATVSGTWSGPNTSTVSGTTGSDGSVLLTSPPASGTFTYTFTVTNISATGLRYDAASNVQTSASVSGTVPNRPPVAVASATPTSGTAPLTVKFSGAQSSDPDGSIVKYAWAFGDGGTSSEVSPQHIYTSPGTYTAKLTVTDDKGATAQDTVTIAVTESTSNEIYVKAIKMGLSKSGDQLVATALVTIVRKDGTPFAGANVAGIWRGVRMSMTGGVTGADGTVLLSSLPASGTFTYTFDVAYVSAVGMTYTPSLNVLTRASINNSGETSNP